MPIDSLSLTTSWQEDRAKKINLTASVHGMYIQGAVMNSGVGMGHCNRDTPSWNPVPPCSLTWSATKKAI